MEKLPIKASTSGLGHELQVVALVYDKLCTFEYGIAVEIFGLDRPELGRELYKFSSVALEKKNHTWRRAVSYLKLQAQ